MSIKQAKNITDNEFIQKVRAAMNIMGWFIPVTDEQLEKAEQRLATDLTNLPTDLQDPYAVFDGDNAKSSAANPDSPMVTEFLEETEALAWAARKGQSIPSDIRDKMWRDRNKIEEQAQNNSSGPEDL